MLLLGAATACAVTSEETAPTAPTASIASAALTADAIDETCAPLFFYDHARQEAVIASICGSANYTPPSTTPLTGFGAWTHLVGTGNGNLFFYNADTAEGYTGRIDRSGTYTSVQSIAGFSHSWTHIVSAGNGALFFYNATTHAGATAVVEPSGQYRYVGTVGSLSGWTHVVGTRNGALFFYNSSSGSAAAARLDDAGHFSGAHNLSGSKAPGPGWTHIVAANQGGLFFYNATTRTGATARLTSDSTYTFVRNLSGFGTWTKIIGTPGGGILFYNDAGNGWRGRLDADSNFSTFGSLSDLGAWTHIAGAGYGSVVAPPAAAVSRKGPSAITRYVPGAWPQCVSAYQSGSDRTVFQDSCRGPNPRIQKWIFYPSPTGGGRYLITDATNGRCLDVENASLANQARLQLSDCHGGTNQQFEFVRIQGTNAIAIRAAHSGKCIDVPNGTLFSTHLQQYDCNSTLAQQWMVSFDPGVGLERPPTAQASAFTRKAAAFFKQSNFYDWLLSVSHGMDVSTGKPDYLLWWQDIEAVKSGGQVTFRQSIGPGGHNVYIGHSKMLTGAIGGYLMTGDPDMGRVVEQYAKGIAVACEGFVHDSTDSNRFLMARNFVAQNHTYTVSGGRSKTVDYSPWFSPQEWPVAERVHFPHNPSWGDIWVTKPRSKDDVPHIYMAALFLRDVIALAPDATVRAAAQRGWDCVQGFARDIVDHDYQIRSKDENGEPYEPSGALIPGTDMASFTVWDVPLLSEPECPSKLGTALIAYGDDRGEDCGVPGRPLYEVISTSNNYFMYEMINSYNLAAALASAKFFQSNQVTGDLIAGLSDRAHRFLNPTDPSPDETGPSRSEWNRDVASFLLRAGMVGMPLSDQHAQVIREQFAAAFDHYTAWNSWNFWDASVPDGVYPHYVDGYRPSNQGNLVDVQDLGFLFSYCYSSFKSPLSSSQLIDCEMLRDPARWSQGCGNGVCEAGETCNSCASDCGTCPLPPAPTVTPLCTGQVVVQLPPGNANLAALAGGNEALAWTYSFQRQRYTAQPWERYTHTDVGPRSNLGAVFIDNSPGEGRLTYRACLRDYSGQEVCGPSTTASAAPSCHVALSYTPVGCDPLCVIPLFCTPCTSVQTFPSVDYPFDPHTSCGASDCTQLPARPQSLEGRIVSIINAENPYYAMTPNTTAWMNYWDQTSLQCLNVADNNPVDDTQVNQTYCANPLSGIPLSQQWIISTVPEVQYTKDGASRLGRNIYTLRSLRDPNLCLEAPGGPDVPANDMHLRECANLGDLAVTSALNQRFSLPGAFSFDSSSGAPDLRIYNFAAQRTSNMCVTEFAPRQANLPAFSVDSIRVVQPPVPPLLQSYRQKWVLYDWASQTIL